MSEDSDRGGQQAPTAGQRPPMTRREWQRWQASADSLEARERPLVADLERRAVR